MDCQKQSHVAINAHLLTGQSSYRSAGIAVYILELLRALAQSSDGIRCTALVGSGTTVTEPGLLIEQARWRTHHPLKRLLWEQLVLPGVLQRIGADVLHAPAFVGPLLAPCPQVITIHDLSFLRHPEYFRRGRRSYLRLLTPLSCRRAAAVIAVSHFTASEVTCLLRVPREQVHVVHNGVHPRFHPLPPAEVAAFRAREGLPERFILYMGTLEPRKNVAGLVRAFADLRQPDVHLVLAGGRGWLYEDIFAEVERLGIGDRVHIPGYVSAETQPLWYNAATIFAYLSNYEGFGLPVLEALACGTPTLTSDTTALPEAAGDAALMAPPDHEAAITDQLDRLLGDAPLREHLGRQGLSHAARFTWSHTALSTQRVYCAVLSPTMSSRRDA